MTTRGTGVLLAGLWVLVMAVASGSVAAYAIGTALVATVLVALATVWLGGGVPGASAERRTAGAWEAPDGQPLAVLVHADRMTGGWAVVERVSQRGRTRRVRADVTVTGPGTGTADLDLAPLDRGRLVLGPLSVEVRDPLLLARRRHPLLGREEVLVRPHPAPVRLPPARGVAGGGSALAGAAGGRASFGGPRRFRPGDPVSRVHWRATARAGELLVRDEEGGPGSLVVVLDPGAWPDDGEAWEAAVSLAAGVLQAAPATRALLGLVSIYGTAERPAPARRAAGRLLDLLAAMSESDERRWDLTAALLTGPARGAAELVVVGHGLGRAGLRAAPGQRLLVLDAGAPVGDVGGRHTAGGLR